jgi:hypothetical protein
MADYELPTKRVRHTATGHPMIINVSDFDPAVHEDVRTCPRHGDAYGLGEACPTCVTDAGTAVSDPALPVDPEAPVFAADAVQRPTADRPTDPPLVREPPTRKGKK